MSNAMDSYLFSNIHSAIAAQKMTVGSVETRVDAALQRIQIATADSYDHIAICSLHWGSDDTGGAKDSALFIKTLETLKNVESRTITLSNDDWLTPVTNRIIEYAQSQSDCRRLFILHYAGHATADSTSDNLIITPTIGQECDIGPQVNISHVKDHLKALCAKALGLDVLLVMDCCCASVAGRGKVKGARVELMAATSPKGISNSRVDGATFTEHWCTAFTELLKTGVAFTCTDIIGNINSRPDLEQFPRSFILREGWEIPITFRASSNTRLPPAMRIKTVVIAFHIQEDPDDDSMKKLLDHLRGSMVPLTVIAALPISSTLLLLHVPAFFQELLGVPRVAIFLTDA